MSSPLYVLEVVARDDRRSTVSIQVTCCNWSGLPGSRPFFLGELYRSAHELDRGAPIMAAITRDESRDDEFLASRAGTFVVAVSADESSYHRRHDPDEDDEDEDEDDDTPHGDTMTYEVEVADVRWIQHLSPGDRWETTGYDLAEIHLDPADEDPATSTDPDGRRGLRRVGPDWIDTQTCYGSAPRSTMPASFLVTTCRPGEYQPDRRWPAGEVTPQRLRGLVGTVARLDYRSASGHATSRVVTLLAVDDAEVTYLERNYSVLIDRVPWDRVTGVATVALGPVAAR